jgi:hypothetical protein
MVQQIGEYTDNGYVVRVFSAAYADGLHRHVWSFPVARTGIHEPHYARRKRGRVASGQTRERAEPQLNF